MRIELFMLTYTEVLEQYKPNVVLISSSMPDWHAKTIHSTSEYCTQGGGVIPVLLTGCPLLFSPELGRRAVHQAGTRIQFISGSVQAADVPSDATLRLAKLLHVERVYSAKRTRRLSAGAQ